MNVGAFITAEPWRDRVDLRMTRRETIIELARTLDDALTTDNVQAGAGGHSNGNDSRALQLSDQYHHGSYRALEDALEAMRLAGDPVRQWRWHFRNRYVLATRKPYRVRARGHRYEIQVDGQWQPAAPRNGHREPVGSPYDSAAGRVLRVEQWSNRVQLELVDRALDWLEANIAACRCRGAKPHSLHLARDWQPAGADRLRAARAAA